MTKAPLGSDTLFAQKVGEMVAREMAKANPRAQAIPAHRWSQKLARALQRLLFVALVVLSVKLQWPWYVSLGSALMALRALAPDLADGSVQWLLRMAKNGKAVRDAGGQ